MDPKRDEVRLPRTAVEALISAQAAAAGERARAVREMSREAGDAIARRVFDLASADEMGRSEFWEVMNAEMDSRGLGTCTWIPRGEACAELLFDGAVETASGRPRVGPADLEAAPFTEGLVEGLLSRTAGESVGAVLVEPDQEGRLRLLVGSPSFLRLVGARLGSGMGFDAAVEGP